MSIAACLPVRNCSAMYLEASMNRPAAVGELPYNKASAFELEFSHTVPVHRSPTPPPAQPLPKNIIACPRPADCPSPSSPGSPETKIIETPSVVPWSGNVAIETEKFVIDSGCTTLDLMHELGLEMEKRAQDTQRIKASSSPTSTYSPSSTPPLPHNTSTLHDGLQEAPQLNHSSLPILIPDQVLDSHTLHQAHLGLSPGQNMGLKGTAGTSTQIGVLPQLPTSVQQHLPHPASARAPPAHSHWSHSHAPGMAHPRSTSIVQQQRMRQQRMGHFTPATVHSSDGMDYVTSPRQHYVYHPQSTSSFGGSSTSSYCSDHLQSLNMLLSSPSDPSPMFSPDPVFPSSAQDFIPGCQVEAAMRIAHHRILRHRQAYDLSSSSSSNGSFDQPTNFPSTPIGYGQTSSMLPPYQQMHAAEYTGSSSPTASGTDSNYSEHDLSASSVSSLPATPDQLQGKSSKARKPAKRNPPPKAVVLRRQLVSPRYTGPIPASLQLWEFILHHLELGIEQDAIAWIDEKSGRFRIVNSEKIASMWGEYRAVPAMDYEKMTRALRYYYRRNILEKLQRRLIYQFSTEVMHQVLTYRSMHSTD